MTWNALEHDSNGVNTSSSIGDVKKVSFFFSSNYIQFAKKRSGEEKMMMTIS